MKHNPTQFITVIALTAVVLASATVRAEQPLNFSVGVGRSYLLADTIQTNYLLVDWHTFQILRPQRKPLNVAFVIDCSGALTPTVFQIARGAVHMGIDQLSTNEIVSVIAFNDNVQVLVPATNVSRGMGIQQPIRQLEAGGGAALFAGISKAAAEVRKFADPQHNNRIILLSNGNATVGPRSYHEITDLADSLKKEGISVTTVGVGDNYNEALLSRLAERSNGNHIFAMGIGDALNLWKVEFGEVTGAVARNLTVKVRFPDGIRPLRVIGRGERFGFEQNLSAIPFDMESFCREVPITGQTVTETYKQFDVRQHKFLLIEVEVPAVANNLTRKLATIEATYDNLFTDERGEWSRTVGVWFTDSPQLVQKNESADVMPEAAESVGIVNHQRAQKLRAAGKFDEARLLLQDNVRLLNAAATRYITPRAAQLRALAETNRLQLLQFPSSK